MGKLVVSNRYATSFFKVGIELEKVDSYYNDLALIADALKMDENLYKVLTHPRIIVSDKKEVVSQLFEKRVEQETLNFLFIIIDKNRSSELTSIIKEFNRIYDEYKNVLNVLAITAVELKEDEKEKLVKQLEELTKRNIKLEKEVDPSIIGGVILKTDSSIIDGSILKQLEDMKTGFKEEII